MQCPECHAPLPDHVAFCYQCGRRLTKRKSYRSLVRTIASEHKQHDMATDMLQATYAVETNSSDSDYQQEPINMENNEVSSIHLLSQGTFIANRYEVVEFLGFQGQCPVYSVRESTPVGSGNLQTCWACKTVIQHNEEEYCRKCGAELTHPPQWAIQQLQPVADDPAFISDEAGFFFITNDQPEHLSSSAMRSLQIPDDPPDNIIDAPTMEITFGVELTSPFPPTVPGQQVPVELEELEQPTMEFTMTSLDAREGVTFNWQQNDAPTVETVILDPSLEALLQGQVQIRAALASDTGQTRQDKPNEDSSMVIQLSYGGDSTPLPLTLCLVADGLGGHDDGQRAGRLTVRIIASSVINKVWLPALSGIMGPSFTAQELGGFLRDGIQEANKHIFNVNKAEGGDMGCTITALIAQGEEACIANVGDSRTYRFNGTTLSAVTHDHSLVARLVAAQMIAPDDIYTHPQRSQIYRSLGDDPRLEIDLFPFRATPGETYVLCSDGLWEMVHDPEIAQILAHSQSLDPALIAHQFVVAANAFGGEDNISVIVAQVVRA